MDVLINILIYLRATLSRIPGDREIELNSIADELAGTETQLTNSDILLGIGVLIASEHFLILLHGDLVTVPNCYRLKNLWKASTQQNKFQLELFSPACDIKNQWKYLTLR